MSIKSFVSSATLVAASLVPVSSLAADTFKVSTAVYQNGQLLHQPEVIVEANKKASVTIGDGFNYELTLIPASNNASSQQVQLDTAIRLNGSQMSPSLIMEYGKQASIEVGNTQLTVLVSEYRN